MGQRFKSSEGVLGQSLDVIVLYEPEGQTGFQTLTSRTNVDRGVFLLGRQNNMCFKGNFIPVINKTQRT